ncbi:MAG: cell shape determination protein CcmA [SAR86 cluster bacterium]|uniref:Cell shape determination protein CcmA n=1 Tax=SAR86 cluster bacterium TaxID=2030880 RepID=A0A2A5AYM9_9GAMM|nr:MAG: cell shape determination protein CcmA [SAR86 cluster bacterium]
MFNKSTQEKSSAGPAHTLVSRTTEIVGDIHFSGELIIEGSVKGSIYAADDSEALIRVAERGSVEGEICVPTAVINGLIQGDVRSATHLELAAKAVVVGNVFYNLIEMVMGSEVNGKLMHISSSENENKKLAANKKKLPFDSSAMQKS